MSVRIMEKVPIHSNLATATVCGEWKLTSLESFSDDFRGFMMRNSYRPDVMEAKLIIEYGSFFIKRPWERFTFLQPLYLHCSAPTLFDKSAVHQTYRSLSGIGICCMFNVPREI